MFNYRVQFEPPAKINAEILQNGEVILVELNFPGIRKLNKSYPGPFRQRRSLFFCLGLNRNSSPIKECNWCKVIDCIMPSSAMRSGEWVSVQMDKKPANCDLWLRIFRRRISVILTPQKNESSEASSTETIGVTRYYFWDSGRLNRILNPRKSEILITDDNLSLRLANDGDLWTDEDAKALRHNLQREKSKDAPGEMQDQFSGGDVVPDERALATNSIEKKVETPGRIELKKEIYGKSSLLGANANANEFTPNKVVSEGRSKCGLNPGLPKL